MCISIIAGLELLLLVKVFFLVKFCVQAFMWTYVSGDCFCVYCNLKEIFFSLDHLKKKFRKNIDYFLNFL